MELNDLTTLGIALGLGLLVGLQRERFHTRVAGIRTFALITLFGTVSGMIARHFHSDWVVVSGGFSIALLLGVANYLKKKDTEPDIGQTTEIAALLMYAIGVFLVIGNTLVGVVLGTTVAVLLYLKQHLTATIERLGEKDLQAIMLFAAISLIILPVLPDQDFGPYAVFNLQEIWLMVVLISGLGIAGYFAYKWLGDTMGTALSGILGGLISSTATAVTYSRQANNKPGLARMAGFVITAASAVALVRIIVEVAVVAPRHWAVVAPPLLVLMAFMGLVSAVLFYRNKKENPMAEEPENPAQFKTALVFAVLYALILFAIAVVKDYFGNPGLYIVSVISGLTDVDAITLSLSNMINDGNLAADQGWRFILVAAMANLLFKGVLVAVIGQRELLRVVAPAFGLTILVGVGVLLWW